MTPRNGFTLIELLIIIVIVGILAAIAWGRFSTVKDQGYITTMESDLRVFATHQEAHFHDHATYVSDVTVFENAELFGGFRPSPGVAVRVIEATAQGWSATARHEFVATECGLFVGDAAPVGAAEHEGIITCQ